MPPQTKIKLAQNEREALDWKEEMQRNGYTCLKERRLQMTQQRSEGPAVTSVIFLLAERPDP